MNLKMLLLRRLGDFFIWLLAAANVTAKDFNKEKTEKSVYLNNYYYK